MQKSAEGIVEAQASKARTVERSTDFVTNVGIASVKQRKLPSVRRRMKPQLGSDEGAPVGLLRSYNRQADSISRTAVYVTRMHGGVGGGGP